MYQGEPIKVQRIDNASTICQDVACREKYLPTHTVSHCRHYKRKNGANFCGNKDPEQLRQKMAVERFVEEHLLNLSWEAVGNTSEGYERVRRTSIDVAWNRLHDGLIEGKFQAPLKTRKAVQGIIDREGLIAKFLWERMLMTEENATVDVAPVTEDTVVRSRLQMPPLEAEEPAAAAVIGASAALEMPGLEPRTVAEAITVQPETVAEAIVVQPPPKRARIYEFELDEVLVLYPHLSLTFRSPITVTLAFCQSLPMKGNLSFLP
eukprot:g36979.t1